METPDDFPDADNQKYYTLNSDTYFNAESYMADVESWFAVELDDSYYDEPEATNWNEVLGNVSKLIIWVGVLLFLIQFLVVWYTP